MTLLLILNLLFGLANGIFNTIDTILCFMQCGMTVASLSRSAINARILVVVDCLMLQLIARLLLNINNSSEKLAADAFANAHQ
jgi:hypothetical protein